MKFILMMLLSLNLLADSNREKKENVRDVSAILKIDKSNSKYNEVLSEIEAYPKINWENYDRKEQTNYHDFVRKLLPYLLNKAKNEDISTQGDTFSKLLIFAKGMHKFVTVSESESSIHSFLIERLRVEREFKACAELKTQYSGQEPLMKVQLDRVDFDDEDFLVKELKSITNRIQYISTDY